MADRGLTRITAATILVALLLGLCNAWLADLNQDEGWYLYASKLVAKGELPYRDFAFTQAPVMPFVYLASLPFVDLWGLLGGRYFTLLLGLAAAGIAAWAAARMAPSEKGATALATFILIGLNCYNSQFTTVVKTYALCSLFLAGGVLFLTWLGTRRGLLASLLAGVLLALAAGTRMSMAIVIPIAFVWLVLKSRRKEASYEWAWFAVGATVTLTLVFLPFILADADNFWFFTVGYHAGRSAGSVMEWLVYRAGFLSRWAGGYSIPFFLALALLLRVLTRRGKGRRPHMRRRATGSGTAFLWISGGAVSAVHLLAPFPYDDYQVAVFPLFAIALGVGAVQMAFDVMKSKRKLPIVLWGLFAASVISSFSSPINQDWFVFGRDRIWWRMKDQPDIVKLQEVGAWLRDASGRRTKLIALDPYLAVESGLEIPQELAMGPFSYYPDLSTAAARELNVCNREILEGILRGSSAAVAAVSGYSFAIESPGIVPVPEQERLDLIAVLEENYERVGRVENFGQAHTLLELYLELSPH